MDDKIEENEKNGTWEVIDRHRPKGVKIDGVKQVYKTKLDGEK